MQMGNFGHDIGTVAVWHGMHSRSYATFTSTDRSIGSMGPKTSLKVQDYAWGIWSTLDKDHVFSHQCANNKLALIAFALKRQGLDITHLSNFNGCFFDLKQHFDRLKRLLGQEQWGLLAPGWLSPDDPVAFSQSWRKIALASFSVVLLGSQSFISGEFCKTAMQ
jgi:hypothetical protein